MRAATVAALVLVAWCGPAAGQDEKPRPLGEKEAKELAALIERLDSKKFAEREKATKEITAFGIRGLEAMEKAAREPLTLEAQRRLGMVIWKLKAPAARAEVRKRIDGLIPVLSSPAFKDRQGATDELIAIGLPALEHLYAAATLHTDPETVRRVDAVIRAILKKAE
jgi:hypothetical protein